MDRCDVVITGYRLNAVEKPAVALQRLLKLSEDEARAMSKRFPCIARGDLPVAEAQALQALLREAGAHVQLREPGRSMPPDTGDRTLPPEAPFVAQGLGRTGPPARLVRIEPASMPALAPAPMAAPMPVATAAIPPPAPPSAALDAYSLFRMSQPTLVADSARNSVYQLGEIEVVATKSQPALGTARSQPAPAPSVGKSQPAPALAATKSQPAPPPASTKSQPAPAPIPDTGGMQMLSDAFRPTGEFGPSLELDFAAVAHATDRVRSSFRPNTQARSEKPKRRGILATLLLPIVYLTTATPHALAFVGVAAASGATVYIVRKSAQAKEQREQDPWNEWVRSDDDATGSTPAVHPLLRVAPDAMGAPIASILRTRIRGVHKVAMEWKDGEWSGAGPPGRVECMLLEQKHAGNLAELTSTGTVVEISQDMRQQFDGHIEVLRSAYGDPHAEFISICLAN